MARAVRPSRRIRGEAHKRKGPALAVPPVQGGARGGAALPEPPELVASLVDLALREDLGPGGDVTSSLVLPDALEARARFVAREPLVVAGLDVAAWVYRRIDSRVTLSPLVPPGRAVAKGEPLAEVKGRARAIYAGERTALNFMQRLSGVATLTRQFSERLAGTGCALLDTRKTTPGHRLLEKEAVVLGGGKNHRLGLYDGILIKDNHVAAAGGIAAAVRAARSGAHPLLRIEVEVDTLAQLEEALASPVDMVLLDNMDLPQLRRAVALRNARKPSVLLEASGGITLDNVWAIARSGVDYLSVGALTHSARSVDIGLDAA
jgi:nicotinate-nucleotide pyrophosphorylase (carboxylating)